MPRARNVPATRKRRKKVLKKARGYFGNKSRLSVIKDAAPRSICVLAPKKKEN